MLWARKRGTIVYEYRRDYLTVALCLLPIISVPRISLAATCPQNINGTLVYDQSCYTPDKPIFILRQGSSGGSVVVRDLNIKTSTGGNPVSPLLMAGGNGESYQILNNKIIANGSVTALQMNAGRNNSWTIDGTTMLGDRAAIRSLGSQDTN
jgi:hypothetical protein